MEYDAFRERLLRRARERGIEDCELYFASGPSMLLSIPDGEEHSFRVGAAFRGTIGGRSGMAYSESSSEEAVEFLVGSVLENAAMASPAPAHYQAPGLRYPTTAAPDPELLERSKLGETREAILREMRRRRNLDKTEGVLHAVHSTVRIANSRGLELSHSGSYVYSVLYLVTEREGVLRDSMSYRGGSHLADIDPPGLVAQGYEKANGYFGATKVRTGKHRVLFPNDTASFMVQGFSVFFSAASVLSSLSLWKGKLGKKVASDCVTVTDDPLDPRGVFTHPFDAEGYPASRRTLIDRGVLTSYLHGVATAAALGGGKPGSRWRLDHTYPLEVHPSNLSLEPGGASLEDMLRMLGEGLYVTDVTAYFHGAGINAVSGEYSMPATGFVVKGGRIVRPFDGVTIAGNLYEMLGRIEAVGNDFLYGLPTSFRPGAPMGYGCYGSPSMIVTDVSVAGSDDD